MLGVAFSSLSIKTPRERPPSPQGPKAPRDPQRAPSQGQVQVFTEASRFHSRTCSIIKTSGV